eukprot:2820314-Pyramimonas_sp.AAC.1
MLGQIEFSSGPEVIIGMVKAAFTSPDSAVKNGTSTLLSSTDVQSTITSKRADCIRFVDIARTCKRFYETE